MLFKDTSIANRGHRMTILDPMVREVGLGHWKTTYSTYYDSQDFGTPSSSEHFFTDTTFCDANANGVYDEGESVGGIEIHLLNGFQEAAWYDVTESSGNFAVPLSDLPDGQPVAVLLVNNSGADQSLSIPLGYNTLGRLQLTNGETAVLGTFVQPHGLTNVGFRNTDPVVHADLRMQASSATVEFASLGGVQYVVESSTNLAAGWTSWTNVIATSLVSRVEDPAPLAGDRRFYRIRLLRE